ncbi:MAG: TlpA family protein disulfide reductase [Armatimonadetes bacterium]|nr:TlpA family protein disulfide reductase [Armatimonadota bacterium]
MEKAYHKRFGKKLQVIGVAIAAQGDPVKVARDFKAKHRLTYPILVDTDNSIARQFGVQVVPTNAVLDKGRKIVYMQSGFDEKAIEHAVKSVIPKK